MNLLETFRPLFTSFGEDPTQWTEEQEKKRWRCVFKLFEECKTLGKSTEQFFESLTLAWYLEQKNAGNLD